MAKILILDDEPITVDMLSIFVRMTGHEAIGAMSVPQFWSILESEPIDVFLLDLMLPDGNGLQICRHLREQPQWCNTPIMIVSAQFPPMVREAETAGASYYLSKPLRLDKQTPAPGCPEGSLRQCGHSPRLTVPGCVHVAISPGWHYGQFCRWMS